MDIINKNIKIVFLSAVLLQLVFLVGLIGYKQYAILTGEKIVLKVVPIDPRSLFQGDYARLNYEINRLDLSKITVEGDKSFYSGERVYVELEKGDKYFSPKKVSREKPKTKYFIRGKAGYSSNNNLPVSYGVEAYFMPEGKARDFENAARNGQGADILIGVSVDAFGQGLIDKIIIGGQEINASDFKGVAAGSEYYRNQSLENTQLAARDQMRIANMEQISRAMDICYNDPGCGDGVNKYLVSETIPKSVSTLIIPLDPSSGAPYNWISNAGTPYGYCIYAVSESLPTEYYIASQRNTVKKMSTAPKTLEDCGVEKPQINKSVPSAEVPVQPLVPIASIEGYVFIDANRNNIFDNGDIPYSQFAAGLIEQTKTDGQSRLEIVNNTKVEKGYYKLEIFKPGKYRPDINSLGGSGVSGWAPSDNCSAINVAGFDIKGGEKIKDCNWMVYFE